MTKDPNRWIPLARIGRAHGVRGELRAYPFNEDSEILLDVDEVLVRFEDGTRKGEEHEVSVDGARQGTGALLIKLHSVDSKDDAEALRGALLCIRRSDFPVLDDGEFYACDVEGAKLLDLNGQEIGVVTGLVQYPSVDALTAMIGQKKVEIPIIDAFIESVDIASAVVTVRQLHMDED